MANDHDDTDPLALIAKRKAEIEASRAREAEERARLDAEAAARAKEEEELAIAERVIARLKGGPTVSLATEGTGKGGGTATIASKPDLMTHGATTRTVWVKSHQ